MSSFGQSSERWLLVSGADPAADFSWLRNCWKRGAVVVICAAAEEAEARAALMPQARRCMGRTTALGPGTEAPLQKDLGAGVVLGSGGSHGRRRWVLQRPEGLRHAAGAVTSLAWVRSLKGLLTPLPLHHISGLMPALRAEALDCPHQWLDPQALKRPEDLPDCAGWGMSLVPTQLGRLLRSDAGACWLQRLGCIWVGGAALPPQLARRCRALGLPISTCYGSTETGAMVSCLAPQDFLRGSEDCGRALPHVLLGLADGSCSGGGHGVITVGGGSIARGAMEGGCLKPLDLVAGHWRSGDLGRLRQGRLEVLGRADNALNSGGETVFPEAIEQALQNDLPGLEALLVVGVPDADWGTRLEALFRGPPSLVPALRARVRALPPAQRPKAWHHCPDLAPNDQGKWERPAWGRWLTSAGTAPVKHGGEEGDHAE